MSPPPTLSLDNIEMSSYRHTERKESEREKESCQYGCFIYRANSNAKEKSWVRICKRYRSPLIDSKESIPPAYAAWQAGTSKNRVVVPARQAWNRFLGSLKDSSSVWSALLYSYSMLCCKCLFPVCQFLKIQTWLLRQKKSFSFLYFLLHVHVLLSKQLIHEIVFDSLKPFHWLSVSTQRLELYLILFIYNFYDLVFIIHSYFVEEEFVRGYEKFWRF
jgi:hypothetical protein